MVDPGSKSSEDTKKLEIVQEETPEQLRIIALEQAVRKVQGEKDRAVGLLAGAEAVLYKADDVMRGLKRVGQVLAENDPQLVADFVNSLCDNYPDLTRDIGALVKQYGPQNIEELQKKDPELFSRIQELTDRPELALGIPEKTFFQYPELRKHTLAYLAKSGFGAEYVSLALFYFETGRHRATGEALAKQRAEYDKIVAQWNEAYTAMKEGQEKAEQQRNDLENKLQGVEQQLDATRRDLSNRIEALRRAETINEAHRKFKIDIEQQLKEAQEHLGANKKELSEKILAQEKQLKDQDDALSLAQGNAGVYQTRLKETEAKYKEIIETLAMTKQELLGLQEQYKLVVDERAQARDLVHKLELERNELRDRAQATTVTGEQVRALAEESERTRREYADQILKRDHRLTELSAHIDELTKTVETKSAEYDSLVKQHAALQEDARKYLADRNTAAKALEELTVQSGGDKTKLQEREERIETLVHQVTSLEAALKSIHESQQTGTLAEQEKEKLAENLKNVAERLYARYHDKEELSNKIETPYKKQDFMGIIDVVLEFLATEETRVLNVGSSHLKQLDDAVRAKEALEARLQEETRQVRELDKNYHAVQKQLEDARAQLAESSRAAGERQAQADALLQQVAALEQQQAQGTPQLTELQKRYAALEHELDRQITEFTNDYNKERDAWEQTQRELGKRIKTLEKQLSSAQKAGGVQEARAKGLDKELGKARHEYALLITQYESLKRTRVQYSAMGTDVPVQQTPAECAQARLAQELERATQKLVRDYARLGYGLLKHRDFTQGIAVLKEASTFAQPDSNLYRDIVYDLAAGHYNWGLNSRDKRKFRAGLFWYEKAVRLMPDDFRVRRGHDKCTTMLVA